MYIIFETDTCKDSKIKLGKIPKIKVTQNSGNKIRNSLLFMSLIIFKLLNPAVKLGTP